MAVWNIICQELVVEDDPKAQGVMMMAYGEYLLLHNNEE